MSTTSRNTTSSQGSGVRLGLGAFQRNVSGESAIGGRPSSSAHKSHNSTNNGDNRITGYRKGDGTKVAGSVSSTNTGTTRSSNLSQSTRTSVTTNSSYRPYEFDYESRDNMSFGTSIPSYTITRLSETRRIYSGVSNPSRSTVSGTSTVKHKAADTSQSKKEAVDKGAVNITNSENDVRSSSEEEEPNSGKMTSEGGDSQPRRRRHHHHHHHHKQEGKEEKEKGGKEKIKISGGFERDSNYVLGIKFNVTAEVQTVEEKRKSRK